LWTDPNETPAEAAVREVVEETGMQAVVLGEPGFAHTAMQGHAAPWTVTKIYAVAFAVIACRVRTVVSMSSTSNWLSNCVEGPLM
jgi:8-oxo-dGTP pyrophosphatase MutT (NUDIX family)